MGARFPDGGFFVQSWASDFRPPAGVGMEEAASCCLQKRLLKYYAEAGT